MPRHYGTGMKKNKRVKALTAKRKRAGNVTGRGGWKLRKTSRKV